MRTALRLYITGLVHGVRFRATMSEVARLHNVSGWVRNVLDGSVEAFLEGEDEDVRAVLEWAKSGPPRARVDSIKVEKTSPRNHRGFVVTG